MVEKTGDQTKRVVRTTMRPDEDLEVTEVQEDELRTLGVLVENKRKDA
jgi:hypothetical protein